MLTMPVLIFATKNRWKWIKTKDSTTFIRSEIAKARFCKQTKIHVEEYKQISWHLQ